MNCWKCTTWGWSAVSDHLMSGFAMPCAALTAVITCVSTSNRFMTLLREKMLKELYELEAKADSLEKEIREVLKERGGI